MSKQKTINVHGIYGIEGVVTYDGGIILKISSAKQTIKLHIEDYLVGGFGRELHKCLNLREHTIKTARALLRGEQ